MIQTPFVRYADSRRRCEIVSNEKSTLSNISASAWKMVFVPLRCPCGPIFSTLVIGLPRSYSCAQTPPSREVSTRSHEDSALTTDTPTPCRPPETL